MVESLHIQLYMCKRGPLWGWWNKPGAVTYPLAYPSLLTGKWKWTSRMAAWPFLSIIQTDAPLGWTHTSTRDRPLSLVGVASVPTADRLQWDIMTLIIIILIHTTLIHAYYSFYYDPLVASYLIRKSVRSNPRPQRQCVVHNTLMLRFCCVVLYTTQTKYCTAGFVCCC